MLCVSYKIRHYNPLMKILLIEDEKRIAQYIQQGLEHKSYVVDVAHDGERGLNLALVEEYDLIILDWMLPKTSGIEILQELRASQIQTPVIMLTAKALVEDRVQGLDHGADDYLTKPFAFTELLARIRAVSRRTNCASGNGHDASTPTQLTAGGLTMDLKQCQVRRYKQKIKLTKKEFALLEFLLRNQGQILNKYQILDRVWSYDSDITVNTVQVYIGYLRKKIDKPFPDRPKLIKTVRGFGYKLVNPDKNEN